MRQIVVIALFSGKAITFLHNQGLECSRTLQRAAGILQRAQDDYYSITPMPFPCLNSPNRDGFCCPFGGFCGPICFPSKACLCYNATWVPEVALDLLHADLLFLCWASLAHVHVQQSTTVPWKLPAGLVLFTSVKRCCWAASRNQQRWTKCSSKAPQTKIDDSNIKRSIEKDEKRQARVIAQHRLTYIHQKNPEKSVSQDTPEGQRSLESVTFPIQTPNRHGSRRRARWAWLIISFSNIKGKERHTENASVWEEVRHLLFEEVSRYPFN